MVMRPVGWSHVIAKWVHALSGTELWRYISRGLTFSYQGVLYCPVLLHQPKAGIYTLGGYSAHADQQELLDFIDATEEPVKRIRLIHGEPDARLALAAKIRERYGVVVDW